MHWVAFSNHGNGEGKRRVRSLRLRRSVSEFIILLKKRILCGLFAILLFPVADFILLANAIAVITVIFGCQQNRINALIFMYFRSVQTHLIWFHRTKFGYQYQICIFAVDTAIFHMILWFKVDNESIWSVFNGFKMGSSQIYCSAWGSWTPQTPAASFMDTADLDANRNKTHQKKKITKSFCLKFRLLQRYQKTWICILILLVWATCKEFIHSLKHHSK